MKPQIIPKGLKKGSTLYSIELYEYNSGRNTVELQKWRVTTVKTGTYLDFKARERKPQVKFFIAQVNPETTDSNGKILFDKLRNFEKDTFTDVGHIIKEDHRLPSGYYTTPTQAFKYRIAIEQQYLKEYQDDLEDLIKNRVGLKNGSKKIAEAREFVAEAKKDLARVKSAFTRWKKAEEKKKNAKKLPTPKKGIYKTK